MKAPETTNPELYKAALLLVMLGENCTKQLMQFFPKDELEKLSQCLEKINEIPQKQAEDIVRECYDQLNRNKNETINVDTPRAFSFDKQRDEQEGNDILNILKTAPPQELAEELAQEQPETIAAMLFHLEPVRAAAIFSKFDQQLQQKIIVHFEQPQFLANLISNLDTKTQNLVLEVFKEKKPDLINQLYHLKSSTIENGEL